MLSTLRLFPVFLAICLLAGCGVKSAYNNADWLVMRWIDDRVTLTAEQKRSVEAALERELAWHCANELPAYAQFLHRVKADVANERITSRTLAVYGEQASEFGQRLLTRIRPTLIDVLASLNGHQVDELMESFEERNRELAEEAERSSSTLQRESVRSMEKGMRRLTGRLTRSQRERLHTWAAKLEPTADLVLERRLDWQARFADAMSIRNDRQAFEDAMAKLLEPGADEFDSLMERRSVNRLRTLETIVDLHRMAPHRQIERARGRLDDLAEDLQQLSCGQET